MANAKSYIIEYKQEMNVQSMKSSSIMTQYIEIIENNKFAMKPKLLAILWVLKPMKNL